MREAIRQKEKENIEAGFSSLEAIFLAEVAFYRKCIQNCRSHSSVAAPATGLNSAGCTQERPRKITLSPSLNVFLFNLHPLYQNSRSRLNASIVDSLETLSTLS
jgi:hypothetical protein